MACFKIKLKSKRTLILDIHSDRKYAHKTSGVMKPIRVSLFKRWILATQCHESEWELGLSGSKMIKKAPKKSIKMAHMQYIPSLLIALWQTDWNFEDKSFFWLEWFIYIDPVTAVKCLLKRMIFSEKRLEFQSSCVYGGFEIYYTSHKDLFYGAFVAFLKLEISILWNCTKKHIIQNFSFVLLLEWHQGHLVMSEFSTISQ